MYETPRKHMIVLKKNIFWNRINLKFRKKIKNSFT